MRIAAAVCSVIVLLSGPLLIAYWPVGKSSPAWGELPVLEGCELGGWNLDFWRPHISGSQSSNTGSYDCDGTEIHVAIHHFLSQRQGAETVGGSNQLLPEAPRFRYEEKQIVNTNVRVDAHIVSLGTDRVLAVWSWYAVGSTPSNDPMVVKLLDVKNTLLFRTEPSVVIVVGGVGATPDIIEPELQRVARELWSRYLTAFHGSNPSSG